MILDKKFYEAHGIFKGSALWLRSLTVSFLTSSLGIQRYLEQSREPLVSWPKLKDGASSLCHSCDLCVKICPTQALSLEGSGASQKLWLSVAQCTQCGLCVDVCPDNILEMGNDQHIAFHGEQTLRFQLSGKAV